MNEITRTKRIFIFFAALTIAGIRPLAATEPRFTFHEVNNSTGLELSDNGKPVFVYNYGMMLKPGSPERLRRSCYLHPVYAPDGTTVLTDDFNQDHPHHRGIFWAWEVVAVDGKTNDAWTVKGIKQKFVQWKARETNGLEARLDVENGWYDGDQQFVKEDVDIVTHPVTDQQRALDFTLTFEAVDKPVMIVGTPDGRKGYGGFAFRSAPRDGGPTQTIIRTDTGISERDGVLARHPWAEIAGNFKGVAAGVRVVDNPANPGYPTNGWLMRHSFALLNVSYPGLTPVTLLPGKPLVLKYRVILFLGETAQPVVFSQKQ